jgi:hypothetical protein
VALVSSRTPHTNYQYDKKIKNGANLSKIDGIRSSAEIYTNLKTTLIKKQLNQHKFKCLTMVEAVVVVIVELSSTSNASSLGGGGLLQPWPGSPRRWEGTSTSSSTRIPRRHVIE